MKCAICDGELELVSKREMNLGVNNDNFFHRYKCKKCGFSYRLCKDKLEAKRLAEIDIERINNGYYPEIKKIQGEK